MENKEAIKYLIKPVATSTKPSAEYLKQKEAYELAIKALEKPQVTVFAENASKEEIKDFKQELENVLEKTQGKWVSVSERLPDKNMRCLVSVGKYNLTEIAMYSDLMGTINHKIFWQGDYGKINFQNITEYVNAWQPLPESYKRGSAE